MKKYLRIYSGDLFFDYPILSGLRTLLGMMGWNKGSCVLDLDKCEDIHSAFMRYPIDLVFVDKRKSIVFDVKQELEPWHSVHRKAVCCYVLELDRREKRVLPKIGDKLEMCVVIK